MIDVFFAAHHLNAGKVAIEDENAPRANGDQQARPSTARTGRSSGAQRGAFDRTRPSTARSDRRPTQVGLKTEAGPPARQSGRPERVPAANQPPPYHMDGDDPAARFDKAGGRPEGTAGCRPLPLNDQERSNQLCPSQS